LAAGLLITHVGLRDTAVGYGGFVALLAASSLGYQQVAHRQTA
jgi:hypothetical protein